MNNLENYNNKQPRLENFNLLNSIPNDNLINIANRIDNISLDDINLNGTKLNDLNSNLLSNSLNTDDNNSLIRSLTKEIINNIKDNNIKERFDDEIYDIKTKNLLDNEIEIETEKKKNKKKKDSHIKKGDSYISYINDIINIKESIILFTIFFLLSQEMIKDFFGKYFSSINGDSEGKVNVQGVVVYGIILTVLFMIIKKII